MLRGSGIGQHRRLTNEDTLMLVGVVAKVNGFVVWCGDGEIQPRKPQCAARAREAMLAGTSQPGGEDNTDGQLGNIHI